MNTNASLTFASTDLILEIPVSVERKALARNQDFSEPNSRYQGYLNELAVGTVLQWLHEDFTPQARVCREITANPSLWEFVNGSAIDWEDSRIIIVPNEAIDFDELRVPQEWVDISSWAGDYYLGVQVEAEEGYVRVCGFCSYEQLKAKAKYDASDRTYSLDAFDIITNINVLGVTRQVFPQESKHISVASLPNLTSVQAQNLISRLGNPEIITPRLAIPFPQWAVLIEHGGWRTSLHQKRLGLPEQWSISQWLQAGVSQIAQQFGWGSLNSDLNLAFSRSVAQNQPQTILSRQLEIAGQSYQLQIIPRRSGETLTWCFRLRNSDPRLSIPSGFKLTLLTEDLQPFPNNEDIAISVVEQLFVEVVLEPGEGIVWQIEPLPDSYQQEILRF